MTRKMTRALLACIAAARQLVPELIAEVERLRAESAQWQSLWRDDHQIAADACAERDALQAEYDQAVEDWGANDELMLASNARLAAEVERLKQRLDAVPEAIRRYVADENSECSYHGFGDGKETLRQLDRKADVIATGYLDYVTQHRFEEASDD